MQLVNLMIVHGVKGTGDGKQRQMSVKVMKPEKNILRTFGIKGKISIRMSILSLTI